VRILGRADDLVKIRGELVDVPALERALQARVGAGGVAVFAVANERHGCDLRVVAENTAAVGEVRRAQDDIFPPYARPREIVVGSIRRTALGKTVRS
jgi:acyl-CoA synthetase (AMP-forming)/AMP-acid ligase II